MAIINVIQVGVPGPQGPQGVSGPPGGGGASVTSAEYLSLVDRVSANSGTGGGGSVSSAEHLSLADRVSANSAQMTSADNALSAAVNVVSNALSNEASVRSVADNALSQAISALSQQNSVDHVSINARLDSAVSALSAADSLLGTRISIVSADLTSLRGDVLTNSAGLTSLAARADSIHSVVSVLIDRVSANSAQMTSADNAISQAVSALSQQNSVDHASINDRISVLSDAHTSLVNRVSANSGTGGSGSVTSNELSATSAHFHSVTSALSVRVDSVAQAVSALSQANSAAHVSIMSAISANSAQMTSADNAISNAVSVVSAAVLQEQSVRSVQAVSIMSAISVESAARAAADTSLDGRITSVMLAVSVNSAQMTSADNAISQAVSALSNQNSVDHASINARVDSVHSVLSQRLSALVLDSLANVSAPSPTDQQALVFNSAQGQWVASTIAAGTGSVTSTELSAVSAAAASADATLSVRIDSVANAVSVVSQAVSALSNQNSADHASLANAISAVSQAVSALSQANSAAHASINNRISANSTFLTSVASALSALSQANSAAHVSIMSAISVNSAQMTSADDAISNAVSVVSAAVLQEQSVRSVQAVSIMSAVSVESAARAAADTSINSRIDSVHSVLSQRISALVLDSIANVSAPSPTSSQALVFNSVAGQWVASTMAGGAASVTSAEHLSLVDRVSANSAQMTSADDAISNAVSVVSAAVLQEQSVRSVQAVSIMSAVSVESAARAAADTSLDGRITSVMSAVSANSAQMTSAHFALSNQTSAVRHQVFDQITSRGWPYVYDSSTTIADPGSGDLRFDNASPAAATQIAISNTSSDSYDVASFFSRVVLTSNPGDQIDVTIQNIASATSWVAFRVTAGSGGAFTTLDVSLIAAGAGAWTNGDPLRVLFSPVHPYVLDQLHNVSAPSPTDGQALVYKSADGQWVPSSAIANNSAQMTSADGALSLLIEALDFRETYVQAGGSPNYTYDSNTADADPGADEFRSDNATIASVTRFNFSYDTSLGGVDFARWFSPWTTLTGGVDNGSIYVYRKTTPSVYGLYRITAPATDNGTYISFPSLTFVQGSGGTFPAGNDYVFEFVPHGTMSAVVSAFNTDTISNYASVISNAASVVLAAEPPIKRVLAGAQVVSGTAPVSVSGFTFSVSNGGTYQVKMVLLVSTPISLASPKFVFSAPGNPQTLGLVFTNYAANANSVINIVSSGVTAAFITTSAVGARRPIIIEGVFIASANGTVALAVGNNVSGGAAGSSITIMAGSHGYVWRMS